MTIVLIAAALLVSRVASTSGRQRERALSGRSFRSEIDASWTVRTRRGPHGFETFALSSTRAHLDAEGIPLRDAIGITITESPASAIGARTREAALPRAHEPPLPRAQEPTPTRAQEPPPTRAQEPPPTRAQEPPLTRAARRAEAAVALLSEVVRTPAAAQGVELSAPARYSTLAGANAAEESYEYVYRGRGNVQLDVVANRAGTIYFIELDTELAHLAQGEAAFSRLLRGWHWRRRT